MPRKDPITGCMVLTTPELFERIAETEGKGQTGGEVMMEVFDDLEKSRVEHENNLRKPDVALAECRKIIEQWNKYENETAEQNPKYAKQYPPDIQPMPVKVLRVVSAEFGESFRHTKLIVEAVADNGKFGTLTVTDTYYGGSFYEPPDGETNIEWKFKKERRAGR